ncbi:MAG: hypothetical protein ACXWJJ_07830, partial [Ramlibacter sp.]
ALAAVLSLSVASVALAQGIVREAPADVRPARMAVDAPPAITLDGKPDRLSPGARIRDVQNMLVLSGNLAGQAVPVVYRRDGAGLVHEVWLLTEDEYARVAPAADGSADGSARFARMLGQVFGTRR